MDNKEYKVPLELQEVFIEMESLNSLREIFANSVVFGYRRAKKASHEYQKLKINFWGSIYKLYPEIDEKELKYNRYNGCVTINER